MLEEMDGLFSYISYRITNDPRSGPKTTPGGTQLYGRTLNHQHFHHFW